jgi:phenylacetate-CoA ligase
MKVLDKIRNIAFWSNDLLKGSEVRKNFIDIKNIVENPNADTNKRILKLRLEKILEHVSKNVTYYENTNVLQSNIHTFPVVNKNIIRDRIDDFVSKGFDKNGLHRVVTSGSTGTPFSVYHDAMKKKRNRADTIYFGSLAGFEIGIQLHYLKIWTAVNRKNKLQAWAENIIPIDVTQLSDENIEKLLVNFAKNNNPKAFLGYASALESICQFIEKTNFTVRISKVKSIIAMSEGLSDYAKLALHKYFGVYPVSRYSNVENGIIAQQLPDGSNTFLVNWASYFVEILDMESDNVLDIGNPGRIVITDYFNYAMPMIRYDTGDIGTLNWDESKKKLLLTNVGGRKMDLVFNTKGNLVSSFTITNNMWLYPEIKQYQFIQLEKTKYLFKLNLDGKFEREELLISEFKNYFGQDAQIMVEYVDEIPLLNSGKRKKVMNISK